MKEQKVMQFSKIALNPPFKPLFIIIVIRFIIMTSHVFHISLLLKTLISRKALNIS